jgi:polyphosphate kinase
MFNFITGYAEPAGLERMAVSPDQLKQRCSPTSPRRSPCQGRPQGRDLGQVNSLVDPEIIDALYDQQAGVEIDFVVRGICCLRPGVPGLSRISGSSRSSAASWSTPASTLRQRPRPAVAKAKIYISSADLMPRNLDRRVEALTRS